MVLRRRHLAKAVSYRFFGSLATAAIALAMTGDAAISASIGLADTLTKIGLFYLHERLWYRIRWGLRPSASGERKD